jgi:hypothetical protein
MNDPTQTLTDQLHLTVDYGQSLQQMIAAGHYDWTNPDITAKWFPIKGAGIVPVETRLFQFDRYLPSEAAVAAITTVDAKNPWERATIEHLLVFGASNPDKQRRYPIVALGSVAEVNGRRYVPYLDGSDAGRYLGIAWWDSDWDDVFRCLAVRSRSSGS